MDIVKKNLVSIVCGVIALVAIAAVWPVSGKFQELQEQVNQRNAAYGQLRDLLNKERHLPVVALGPNSTPEKLERFPTDNVIAKGNQVKEAVESEAKALYQAAVQINQEGKKLLVAESLPWPRVNGPLIAFRRDYQREMDFANTDLKRRQESMPYKLMQAGTPPTEEEIKAEGDLIDRRIRGAELAWEGNKPVNEPQVKAKIAAELEALPQRMRHQTANNCKVYVDAESFDVAQAMVGGSGREVPTPPQVFWTQMGLWLQQDICRAIADANAQAQNVTESPVKRVVKTSIPNLFNQQQGAAQPGFNEMGEPIAAAPPADPAQPLTPNYTKSPTGRESNALYDVIPFQLSLIVDADRVPIVLQSLSKNRFITVLQTNIVSVDSGIEQGAGYVYGPQPVVQLDMNCEALFMREWTKAYMPPMVKTALGIVEEPVQPPG